MQILSDKLRERSIAIIAMFFVGHIFYGVHSLLEPVGQRNIHLTLALILSILAKPLKKTSKKLSLAVADIIDLILVLLIIAQGIYTGYHAPELSMRQGIIYQGDYFALFVLVVTILEMGRRFLGMALPAIAIGFLIYTWIGPYMPGFFHHSGISPSRLVTFMYMNSISGIFGNFLGISVGFIALFIIFGSVLMASGVGDFFMNTANSLLGGVRGGAAKVAIFSSAAFGTVTGAASANVVTTGSLTIPMMTNMGYSPVFAGAVEAVASSAGQIMPPIMGVGAFLMSDILGIPYSQVAIAATLPAIIYFISIFFGVDCEAEKLGLKGIPKDKLPRISSVFKKQGYYIVPIGVLIYFLMIARKSPGLGAFWSIIIAIVVSWIGKDYRMTPGKIIKSFTKGSVNSLIIVIVCGIAAIIVGTFGVTGLALKLTSGLIELAAGKLFLVLVLAMIASIILGMGLPTGVAYILVAIFVAPALIGMGVMPIAAHMFVFYFAIISAITPPVAIAAYAASGISHASPNWTGFYAMKLALAAFLVPYVFVYSPELLLITEGGTVKLILVTVTAVFGSLFLALGAGGYYKKTLPVALRIGLIICSILSIMPGHYTDIIGIISGFTILFVIKRTAG